MGGAEGRDQPHRPRAWERRMGCCPSRRVPWSSLRSQVSLQADSFQLQSSSVHS